METLKKSAKYLLFLFIGVFIFVYFYKDMDLAKTVQALKDVNYFWIVVSILLSLLSHLSRAIRWKMLIKPLGYDPKVSNIFLSVLVLYFTNLIFPRAGEVARCTILSRYEKVPLTTLIGTMIVERIADLLTMMLLAVIIFLVNISLLRKFFMVHPEFGQNVLGLLTVTNILLCIAVIVLLVVIFLILKPIKKGSRMYELLRKVKHNFKEGIKSILMLENRWLFVAHTLFIFLMWLLMLYVVFLAFPPTRHLGIGAGMFVFLMGGLAMLMPVQGGIGPWHVMVAESLYLYGISFDDGRNFALIAHSTTSLIYFVLGGIALIIFPMVNRKVKHHASPVKHKDHNPT
jgi:glycosyltransferase 2 family protein